MKVREGVLATDTARVPVPNDQLVFGKPSWATAACQDLSHARWVESEGSWFVNTKHDGAPNVRYECGDCSAKCVPLLEVPWKEKGLENCTTRFLRATSKMDCDAISKSKGVSPRTVNIAVYGDSHFRALFFHIWRLLSDLEWPKELPQWMQTDDAGGRPWGHGEPAGATGHQVHNFSFCEDQLRIKLEFHYKTYYLGSWSEADFLRTLTNKMDDKLDLLIVGESIWSTWESKFVPRKEGMEGFNMPLKSEQEYFLNWVARNFAPRNTYTIFAVGNIEEPTAKLEETSQFISTLQNIAIENPSWNGCVFNRGTLSRPPDDMVCTHGCDGPVPMIHAQAILRSLFQMASGKSAEMSQRMAPPGAAV